MQLELVKTCIHVSFESSDEKEAWIDVFRRRNVNYSGIADSKLE